MPIVRYRAAGGVLADGDRVLVLRRPHRGEIRLPKGHIEPDEQPAVAALREVAEESGHLDLEIVADLGEQTVRFGSSSPGRQVVRVERYFLMRLTGDRRGPGEAEFVPVWLSWEEAEGALTFEPERVWVRRARAVASGASGARG